MLQSRFLGAMFAGALMFLVIPPVFGQDYPSKPLRIVTSPAGGGNDVTARLIAPGLAANLGQQVIIDNRATSVLSSEFASRAAPDGYTLHVNGGNFWVTPLLEKVPYDPIKDFSPITLLSTAPSVLAVHPSLPAKSVKELIALAKARPGQLNYAAGSAGSAGHLASELFKFMAAVDIVHVPYKGGAQGLSSLIGGETQVLIADPGLVAPHAKSGRLRALAVTSLEPSALYPGLPTVASSGLSGYEAVRQFGIWAPAKTPAPILNRLNQEIVRVLNLRDVKDRFFTVGAEIVGNSPDQFAATIKTDMARTGKLIRGVGIKPE